MSDESLTTVLGFDATNAIATLSTLQQSLAGYTFAMRKAASATRAYNKAAKGIDTVLAKQGNAIQGFAAAQTTMATETKKGVTALKSVETQAASTSKRFDKLAATTQKASKQMILSWQSVIRIFVIQVAHQMVSKITGALKEAVDAARKFEIAISEVETIADTVGLSFDELAQKAIEAATAIGQPLEVVVEAQYQLLSNQVGDATQSFLAFEASQRLSLVAVTPLNSAVALITGTLNAYGESAATSDVLAAKLFKTVELGRVRIGELGDSLGRVTVLGAELGISIDEVLASIATLTIQGVKASDAMTQILNVQLKLIRPTDALKEAMASLGFASSEAGIQALGFQGFLEALRDTTEGTASELGELFGRVRATRGALGVTGKAAEKYAKNLKAIREATSDLLDEKLELIFATNAKQVEIELNRLNIQITESFGRGVNVILRETFEAFGGATETLFTFTAAAAAAGTTFLLLRSNITATIPTMLGYTTTTDLATGATIRLKTASIATTFSIKGMAKAMIAFMMTPLGAAIAISAAVVGIAWAFNKAKAAAKKFNEELQLGNELTLKRTLKRNARELEAAKNLFKDKLSETQKHLTKIVKLELEAAKKTEVIEKAINESIVEQIQDRAAAIQAYADGASAIIDNLHSKLKNLRKDTRSIKDTIESFKFERKTKGMDDIEKFYANIERSQSLRFKSQSAIRKGEIELGKTLNEQAGEYADQALAAADASKNSAAIRKAEQQKVSILNDQLNANRVISRQEISKAANAEKAGAGLFKQAVIVKSIADEYKSLGDKISDIKTTDEERIKHVQKQLELAGKLESEIAKFAKRFPEAVALDLEEPFKQALKGFREPLTGVKMDLSSAILFDATRIANSLQVALDAAGKKVKFDATKLAGLPTTASATQIAQALTKTTEELAKQGKIQDDLIKSEATIKNLRTDIVEPTKAITKALLDSESWYTKVTRSGLLDISLLREPEAIVPKAPIGQDVNIQNIQKLTTAIVDLIQNGGDIGEISEKIIQLQAIGFDAAEENMVSVSNRVKEVVLALEKGRDAFVLLQDNAELDMSPAIQELNRLRASSEAGKRSVEALEVALRNLSQTRESESQARAFGGMIYRQYGGFTPRGTDTIPAMLSPGEFVMSAKASQRFASQLVAMNAGAQPIYREMGGPVTNIGDVNITVQGSDTPKQTARETMSLFRRELRRRTSSF